MPRPAKRLTARDYAALPEDGYRYEIIEGELIMSPAPSTVHQLVIIWLLGYLLPYVQRRDGCVFTAPITVELDDINIVQPDVLYLGRRSLKKLTREKIRGAPDLVVEVLSPSRPELDRERKRWLYAAHGVREYWIVDPMMRVVLVHRRAQDRRFTKPQTLRDRLSSPMLPGLQFPLEELWREVAALEKR